MYFWGVELANLESTDGSTILRDFQKMYLVIHPISCGLQLEVAIVTSCEWMALVESISRYSSSEENAIRYFVAQAAQRGQSWL